MSARCCTAATGRSSARRSCAPRRAPRRAIRSGPSSTKSATSLPSLPSPAPPSSGASASRWAWIVGLAVALATLTFPLRAVRWRLILRDVGGARFPLGPLWHATAIGFMANNLLPARAGEFARAYAAKQALPVRFTTALASVGVERVFDGLMLVGLLAVALAAPSFPHAATIGGTSLAAIARGGAALFGAVLVIALLVVHRPAPWLALLRRVTLAVLPARLGERLIR